MRKRAIGSAHYEHQPTRAASQASAIVEKIMREGCPVSSNNSFSFRCARSRKYERALLISSVTVSPTKPPRYSMTQRKIGFEQLLFDTSSADSTRDANERAGPESSTKTCAHAEAFKQDSFEMNPSFQVPASCCGSMYGTAGALERIGTATSVRQVDAPHVPPRKMGPRAAII